MFEIAYSLNHQGVWLLSFSSTIPGRTLSFGGKRQIQAKFGILETRFTLNPKRHRNYVKQWSKVEFSEF